RVNGIDFAGGSSSVRSIVSVRALAATCVTAVFLVIAAGAGGQIACQRARPPTHDFRRPQVAVRGHGIVERREAPPQADAEPHAGSRDGPEDLAPVLSSRRPGLVRRPPRST